ncbi:MAG TPA: septal ring lytic transglycosylase RlpA family protein [Reyranella sp.]|nr:septal ring lytic transglycosylase RlpA family protein [Reyranella sp.]
MPQPVVIRRSLRLCCAFVLAAWLAGCASHHAPPSTAATRGMYKIGAPYTIDGITYVPQEEFNHVETGVASWYGPGFHGKYTANGETYDQSDHTAAHRTLQMPSVVKVTNLDNGLSTTVRINDRGPYARNRIIDMSRAAAEDLGMVGHGTARVRIEQLSQESEAVKEIAMNGGGPAEQQAALAKYVAGRRGPPAVTAVAAATPPPATPPVQVYPRSPEIAPVQGSAGGPTIDSLAGGGGAGGAHAAGGFYVQTGAFSTMGNAEKQRGLVSSYGSTEISQGSAGGHEVYRVRIGPYTTSDAAGIVADRLKRSGYGDARVVAD